jgi:RNA polymerase sigma-32 factor
MARQRDGRAERAGALHRAERKLREEPRTLESLGNELGLSKERVRQLEAAAFGKMRKTLEAQSKEVRSFLAI